MINIDSLLQYYPFSINMFLYWQICVDGLA